MSANCLVTKLKSVVTNDNLVKVGELRYKFTTAGQMELLNRQVDRKQYPIVIVPKKVIFTLEQVNLLNHWQHLIQ